MQLARLMEERLDLAGAQDALSKALDANRNNTRLHYAHGEFLPRNKLGTNVDLEYHVRLGYTLGDSNYGAPLLHGRQYFIAGDFDGSRDMFEQLSRGELPPQVKSKHMFSIEQDYKVTIHEVEVFYLDIRRVSMNRTVPLRDAGRFLGRQRRLFGLSTGRPDLRRRFSPRVAKR